MCTPSPKNSSFSLQKVIIFSETISFDYLITTTIPSNASFQRIWCLNAAGNMVPISHDETTFRVVLDYTEAQKLCNIYRIKFDGPITGTFIVNNKFFSAQKYMKYNYDPDKQIFELEIRIPDKARCFPAKYEFVIYIPDSAAPPPVYSLTYGEPGGTTDVYQYTPDGFTGFTGAPVIY